MYGPMHITRVAVHNQRFVMLALQGTQSQYNPLLAFSCPKVIRDKYYKQSLGMSIDPILRVLLYSGPNFSTHTSRSIGAQSGHILTVCRGSVRLSCTGSEVVFPTIMLIVLSLLVSMCGLPTAKECRKASLSDFYMLSRLWTDFCIIVSFSV